MGVTYKIKPEITKFIIEQKKEKPALSCRILAGLVDAKFKAPISKSSINSIVKSAGLSMPVGRREKKAKSAIMKQRIVEKIAEVGQLLIAQEKAEKPRELEVKPTRPILIPPEISVDKKAAAPIEMPPQETLEKPIEIPAEKAAETPIEEAPLQIQAEAPIEEVLRPVVEKAELPVAEVAQQPAAQEVIKEEQVLSEEKKEVPVKEIPEEKITQPPVIKDVERSDEMECSGAILLKAADSLIAGSSIAAEIVKKQSSSLGFSIAEATEALVFLPLFEKDAKGIELLQTLVGSKISLDIILSYLDYLQRIRTIESLLTEEIFSLLKEVRCLKVDSEKGNTFYIDAEWRSTWPTSSIPSDFAGTPWNIKSYINKCFFRDTPFILQIPLGMDALSKEFLDLITALEGKDDYIKGLSLYGSNFTELEKIELAGQKKYPFIFGLWPWQFVSARKVSSIAEFRPFDFPEIGRAFLLADVEIILTQPVANKSVTLKGVALKTGPAEKICFLILTNFGRETVLSGEEIARLYLSRWPNFEEGFSDLNRKIEFFTYTGAAQADFSPEKADFKKNTSLTITALLANYLKALDLYVKSYFLPLDWALKDFPTMKSQFYGLRATLKKERSRVLATFHPPQGYAYSKDLQYACRRLNERGASFSPGVRLWFKV